MIKIGVIGLKDGWSSQRLVDTIERKTGFRCLIDMNAIRCDVESGDVFYGEIVLRDLDALIIKKIGVSYSSGLMDRMEILRYLQSTGLPIYSKPGNIMRALDRLSCTLYLRRGNIPMPPTVVTENIEEAVKTVQSYGKAVLKPLFTSKARGMKLVSADNNALAKVKNFKEAGNSILYIQKLVPLPGRDLGLVFLGGEYLGTYARVKSGDSWNTTINSGGRYEACQPEDHIIELASRAQSLFELDFTCVDIAETPDGPMVFEVSPFGGFRGLKEALNIDASELYVDYVLKKLGM